MLNIIRFLCRSQLERLCSESVVIKFNEICDEYFCCVKEYYIGYLRSRLLCKECFFMSTLYTIILL